MASQVPSQTRHSQQSNHWACTWFKHFQSFWSLSRFITKFPRSTSATRAISVLSPIILPLQTFFSRVLLLRQQAFSSGNLTLERPTTTTTAIITQVFMFRYEHVNSTRKFTIVAEIVSLLKKIYKRDGPLRAVFKVKTLAVLFPPYPCEMKTNTAKFKSAAILALASSMEMMQLIPTRGYRARVAKACVLIWSAVRERSPRYSRELTARRVDVGIIHFDQYKICPPELSRLLILSFSQ